MDERFIQETGCETGESLSQRMQALQEANSQLQLKFQRLEELSIESEAASLAKSEFLATMSHELRTPLHGVLGYADLLAQTALDEEQKEYIQTIIHSGKHLLEVVNDILDFSSIERGRIVLETAPVEIGALARSSILSIRQAAIAKGIDIRFESAPTVPKQIVGDERRMRQILINLIGNAIKFTETGFVLLRISCDSFPGGPILNFSVVDTGLGISPELLGKLFDPFVQADSILHRGREGNGLGLAIAKRLAEAMGGAITVVSALGKGSTFTFGLPFTSAPSSPADSLPAPFQPSTLFPNTGKHVLVADDDRIGRNIAGILLGKNGYSVEFARDGREAVGLFAPGKYFAILMDMQMPVMDGIEASRRIREIESDPGERVPIIALTANVMSADRQRCLDAGMTDVLIKPYTKEKLAEMLSSLNTVVH